MKVKPTPFYMEIKTKDAAYITPLLEVDTAITESPVLFDGMSFYCPFSTYAMGVLASIQNEQVEFVFKFVDGKHLHFRKFKGAVTDVKTVSGDVGDILPIKFEVYNSSPFTFGASRIGPFKRRGAKNMLTINSMQKVGE